MANSCHAVIVAVSPCKGSLEEFLKIVHGDYGDEKYIYRTYNVRATKTPRRADRRYEDIPLYKVRVRCTVAWGASPWFAEHPDPTSPGEVTLPDLCRKLGMGVEMWAYEYGAGFEEHGRCGFTGKNAMFDSVPWGGKLLTDGFPDFGEFSPEDDIYRGP